MNSLLVQLENCYGIQSFDHTFDFNEKNSILIYAPNGVMKTSFAKTLLQISNGLEPEEKIYNRESTYKTCWEIRASDKQGFGHYRIFKQPPNSSSIIQ